MISYEARKINKKIIEINTEPSNYTDTITDVFLQGKATEIMQQLLEKVRENKG